MKGNQWWRVASLLLAAGVFWGTTGFAGQWLGTAADPTCAVIEKAEYDASRKLLRITGRSSEAITLRIYDRETNEPLIVAERPETGKWTVDFHLVDANAAPGMVVVQATGGCATLRLVTEEALSQAPQPENAATVAALGRRAIVRY